MADPTPTPEEREKEAAAKQKEAEARKATAEATQAETEARKTTAEADKAETEAKQAKLKAQIPAGEATPVEGKTTADDKAGYVATLAAYNVMIQKADDIAAKIKGLPLGKEFDKARILIVDSLDFSSPDVQLLQLLKQLELWKSELGDHLDKIESFTTEINKIIKPAVPSKPPSRKGLAPLAAAEAASAGFAATKGIISSIADIIGYFKVDYDVKGQEVVMSNVALQSLVAGRLETQKCSVYRPGFNRIVSPNAITVIKDFNECIDKKNKLRSRTPALKELISNPLVEQKKKDGTPEEIGVISEAAKACEIAETLIKDFAEFNKAITSMPEGGSYSPFASAALRQYLDVIGITHLLYLTVTSSGGEMVTGEGLFQWGQVSFLGGCVITYILAKCSGEIIAADTLFGCCGVKYKLHINRLTEFKTQKPVNITY